MSKDNVNPLVAQVGDEVSFMHGVPVAPDEYPKPRMITGTVHHVTQPDERHHRTRQIIVMTDGGPVTCHIQRRY